MNRCASASALRFGLAVIGLAAAALGSGCLTRPIVQLEPTNPPIFEKELRQETVDKVDILFAIDNKPKRSFTPELSCPGLIHR